MASVTGCSYFKNERSCFTCPYPDCIGHKQIGELRSSDRYVTGTPEEMLAEYERRSKRLSAEAEMAIGENGIL